MLSIVTTKPKKTDASKLINYGIEFMCYLENTVTFELSTAETIIVSYYENERKVTNEFQIHDRRLNNPSSLSEFISFIEHYRNLYSGIRKTENLNQAEIELVSTLINNLTKVVSMINARGYVIFKKGTNQVVIGYADDVESLAISSYIISTSLKKLNDVIFLAPSYIKGQLHEELGIIN